MTALPPKTALRWPEAVVFDLDGTLVDSALSIRLALNGALAEAGYGPLDTGTVKTMIGAGPEVLVQCALTALSGDNDTKTVHRVTQAFLDVYRELGNKATRLLPGVETGLAELAMAGIRMGICTNKPDALCVNLLKDLDVAQYFSAIQGSGTGLPNKPDPRPLINILRKLGVSQDNTLYVGDSETDVRTARAAGVQVALVRYGYTEIPADQLGADWVMDSLFELPHLRRTGIQFRDVSGADLPPRQLKAS
jgi:phosphoglycolate phosphatase